MRNGNSGSGFDSSSSGSAATTASNSTIDDTDAVLLLKLLQSHDGGQQQQHQRQEGEQTDDDLTDHEPNNGSTNTAWTKRRKTEPQVGQKLSQSSTVTVKGGKIDGSKLSMNYGYEEDKKKKSAINPEYQKRMNIKSPKTQGSRREGGHNLPQLSNPRVAAKRKRKGTRYRYTVGACARCYNKKLKCVGESEESRYPCQRCVSDGVARNCGAQEADRISLNRNRLSDIFSVLAKCKRVLAPTGPSEAIELIGQAEGMLHSITPYALSPFPSPESPAKLKRAPSYKGAKKEETKPLRAPRNSRNPIEFQQAGVPDLKPPKRTVKRRSFVKRAPRACIRCRSRKVRCNQDAKAQFPCQRCIADGFANECMAHVSLPEAAKVLGIVVKDQETPRALADHRNRHQGIQCPRNRLCLRPAKHPGHCRLHGQRRSRSISSTLNNTLESPSSTPTLNERNVRTTNESRGITAAPITPHESENTRGVAISQQQQQQQQQQQRQQQPGGGRESPRTTTTPIAAAAAAAVAPVAMTPQSPRDPPHPTVIQRHSAVPIPYQKA